MTFRTINQPDSAARIIDELRSVGVTYFPKNSKGRALALAVSKENELSSRLFNQNANRMYPRYASGDLLELICAIFGVFREQPTRANAFIYEENQAFYVEGGGNFGSVNGGADFTIPSGEIISSSRLNASDSTIQFKLTTPLTLAAADTVAYANIEAVKEGKQSNIGKNALTELTFTGYSSYLSDTLKTTNRYAIVNGQDRETEEELRFKLSIAATANEAANDSAIRLALLKIPGLVDMKIIRYWDGIGTSGAFVLGQGNESPPALVTQSQESVNQKTGNANLTTIYSPPQLGVGFSTKVNLSEPITINEQNEIEASLLDIIERTILAMRIGQTLNLRQMLTQMYRVDSRIVSFGTTPNESSFDTLYIYRTSTVTGERIRSEWLNQEAISTEEHEVIITESSLSVPYVFTWQSFE